MLILPLHRLPTRATFPWVTLALVLVNVFVFTGWQLGGERARERAIEVYVASGLGALEFPAYAEWLAAKGDSERAREFGGVASANPKHAALVLNHDDRFTSALDAGTVVPRAEDMADWRVRRDVFTRAWNAVFTERWLQRFDRFDPVRMISATYLHGGFGHLVGNLVFLVMLGLLVEGALGAGLFFALYTLGGFGASLASLAWNWGEPGGALGASGAIAALMGAYCVLWGMRRVRFFWWFFFIFNYVKAPALVLLPAWLGWELYNLAFTKGAGIGFEAHAGGIVSGALLGLAVVALGWQRRDFLDEEERADAAVQARDDLERALDHVGRLEIPAARKLLEPLAARNPADLDVLEALYRCARCEKGQPRLVEAATAVLGIVPRDADDVASQRRVFDDVSRIAPGAVRLPAALRVSAARQWARLGQFAPALRVLATIDLAEPAAASLAGDCLAVAQRAIASGETAVARPLLEAIVRALPSTPEAGKARVLLGDTARVSG